MHNRTIKILLVEDDEDDYILTCRLLAYAEGAQFVLDWADNYSAGLEALSQQSHDIYLVDYQLGESNGIQFVREAAARGNTAPIILLTGQGGQNIDLAAMEAGAADYISKDQITAALLERSIRYAIQHKQTEYDLRLAEEKYRSIFENAIYGIFRIAPEGAVIDANPAAARMLGYASPAELRALLTHVDTQLFADAFQWEKARSALKLADHVEDHEVQLYRKDGSALWIAINLWMVRDESGKPLFCEGSFQDVTERKQANQWLKQAKEDLEARVVQRTMDLQEANEQLQSELLERKRIEIELHHAKEEAERANNAKSEFLSRMSHELRTPLNSILGFAQLLEMENLPPDDQDNVEQILRAGRHLLQLINEVLDIAIIEAGRLEATLEPLVAGQCIADALTMIRPLADMRRINIHYAAGSFTQQKVLADERRLRQVLLNLLSNAVKYNKQAGSITITCEEVLDHRLRINIADTGTGISDENRKKLFSPFERLGAEEQNIEGNGLGLALSKRLIEAMNGSIGVESAAGEGSIFWIELPLAPSADSSLHQDVAEKPSTTQSAEGFAASQPERTVLCIEDNPTNLALVRRIFDTRPDLRLLTAIDGSRGVAMACEHRPDLILLDMRLPDFEGDEVLRRLQQNPQTCYIPVCMLSSDAMQDQIQHMLSQGALAYLTKPIDLQQFLNLLDEMLFGCGKPGQ